MVHKSDWCDNRQYSSHSAVEGSTIRELVIMEWRKIAGACGSGCSGR
jgi:hypothetical protein